MADNGFPRPLVDGYMGGRPVTLTTGSNLFLPYAANRISAAFAVPAGNNIVFSNDPTITWANQLGVLFAGANTVMQLNRYMHGVMVRGPIYAAAAAGVTIYVFESFSDAP